MISFATNVLANASLRSLATAQRAIATSLERLSTGKQINRASDDPAGSVAVDHMSARLREIEKEVEGQESRQRYYGARDGGEAALSELVSRLDSLVVRAANKGGMSLDERESLQTEADGILKALDTVSTTTVFNGNQILSQWHSTRLGVSADSDSPDDGAQTSLADFKRGGRFNLIDGDLEKGQTTVRAAESELSRSRAQIGASLRASDSEIATLQSEFESLSGERSRIQDTDVAKETAALVRAQVLQQAAIMMAKLAAGSQSSTALMLLSGLRGA